MSPSVEYFRRSASLQMTSFALLPLEVQVLPLQLFLLIVKTPGQFGGIKDGAPTARRPPILYMIRRLKVVSPSMERIRRKRIVTFRTKTLTMMMTLTMMSPMFANVSRGAVTSKLQSGFLPQRSSSPSSFLRTEKVKGDGRLETTAI